MKALAIAGTNLRLVFRDRTNLFFILVLPLLLVLVLGAAFGSGGTPKLGVVGTGNAHLLDALRAQETFRVEEVADATALRAGVERGEFSAGVVLVAQDEVRVVARSDQGGRQIQLALDGVLARESARLTAGDFVAAQTGADRAEALSTVGSVASSVPPVAVDVVTVGDALFPEGLGRFDANAPAQLLLFMFLTALTSSAALVESRRLGVSRRMLATPTSAAAVVFGEGLGRVAVALLQGLIIIVGTALLFGVDWGDPVAAVVLMLAFALVAGGAGMVLGSLFRTAQQVGGFGLLLGLGLAVIGGSMVPLELFSGTIRTVAYLTPHAWANQGFAELTRRGGDMLDVLPELAVLSGWAAALFVLGAWLLRRAITT